MAKEKLNEENGCAPWANSSVYGLFFLKTEYFGLLEMYKCWHMCYEYIQCSVQMCVNAHSNNLIRYRKPQLITTSHSRFWMLGSKIHFLWWVNLYVMVEMWEVFALFCSVVEEMQRTDSAADSSFQHYRICVIPKTQNSLFEWASPNSVQ